MKSSNTFAVGTAKRRHASRITVTAGVAFLLSAAPAAASNGDDDSGLTLENARSDEALTLQATSTEQAAEEPPQFGTFTLDDKGLVFRSGDGKNSFKIGGRLQAEASFHSDDRLDDVEIIDGSDLRRARIELKGNVDQWIWAAEVDFALNRVSIKDFWMGYEYEGGQKLTAGNQKQPFSLDLEMSSNDIPFIERGINSIIMFPFVDRALGVRLDSPTEKTFFSAGIYGEGVAGNFTDDEGWGATSRFIYAPVQTDNSTVHLGVRGSWRDPSGQSAFQLGDETTNMSDASIVATGTLGDIDEAILYGAEAAVALGRFSVYGEYTETALGLPGDDADFNGWHLAGTWTLTGESRAKAYNIGSGEFKRIVPDNPGSNPFSGGAWELAARWANVDLQDGPVIGGEQDAGTLGLNWYANNNVRFMLGWTHVFDTSGGDAATADAEGLDIYTFRLQMLF